MHPISLPTCSQGWEEGTCPGILFSVHLKAEQCGFVELCLFCDCILLLKWVGDRVCSAGLQPLSAPPLPKAEKPWPLQPLCPTDSLLPSVSVSPTLPVIEFFFFFFFASELQVHPFLPCFEILLLDPVNSSLLPAGAMLGFASRGH